MTGLATKADLDDTVRGFKVDLDRTLRDQKRVLAEGKARAHRWAPEAGYVTFIVDDEQDLKPAMDLIRMSHHHFASKQGVLRTEH